MQMVIDVHNTIAKCIAGILQDGQTVNLGIGIPTLVTKYIADKNIFIHTENGILGLGGVAEPGQEDPEVIDPGSQCVTVLPGGMFMESPLSFGLIWGGHVDVTVLGALQVDEKGNLANWTVPGKMIAGVGGAMDLVTCVPTVIVAMEHTNRGKAKILEECTFPLTGFQCVNYIITEMGMIEVTSDGLVLRKLAASRTVEEVQNATAVKLIIPKQIEIMEEVKETLV